MTAICLSERTLSKWP